MEILELLKKSEREIEWLDQNFEMISKEYDQKFVAIKEGKVVAIGTDMEEIIKNLKAKKIDPSVTLIKFISSVPIVL